MGCERVGRLLEELEALIPGENPEEEEMENQLQDRLEACQVERTHLHTHSLPPSFEIFYCMLLKFQKPKR